MALIAGKLISEVVRTIISYWMPPEIRPRFTWDDESLRALIKFGRWILIGTALTFLARQSDRLILAKLISFRMLGIYGIAFAISDIPRQIILQFCGRVGFPFIARFSSRPRKEYQDIIIKYRMPVLAVGGLLLIIVICTGDFFIRAVYDKRYHDAAWMIGILTLGLWHTLLYSTTSPAILSLQKSHYNAIGYLVYCVSLYAAAAHRFSLAGNARRGARGRSGRFAGLLRDCLQRQSRGHSPVFPGRVDDRCLLRQPGRGPGSSLFLGFGSPFANIHW